MAALFVATSTQATVYERNFYGWPDKFETVEHTNALAGALELEHFRAAYNQEKKFQQNIQLGVLAGSGVVVTAFFGCIFAEWLQEFKVRKAEKAKLIARLHSEIRHIKATRHAA